jgi:ATP-dependent RNA helicase RhlE
MSFSNFGLAGQLLDGVRAAGYTDPTKIQTLAIPAGVEGKDVVGCAQTGTGKTAAFVLPMMHRLSQVPQGVHFRFPRALIITPTRELAQQVHAACEMFGRPVEARSVSVFGGVGMDQQVKMIRRGCDVIVATPGRLLDHLQRGTVDLSKVEILVLDEADRMLDMGFIHDVRKIIARVPRERQTMLFSATLSVEIRALASTILRDPVEVDAGGRHNPAESVEQSFYAASRETKIGMLLHALTSPSMESVLVFSRTKHGADKICRRLERTGISTAAIHANRSQAQRDRALAGFKQGKFRVLVATDIAARGIDVTGISHVVNYDIPQEGESYVHRIGRTGRAGATGKAITFVASEDRQFMQRIEQFTGRRFAVHPYPVPIEPQQPMNTGRLLEHPRHPRVSSPGFQSGRWKKQPRTTQRRGGKQGEVFSARRKKPAKPMETFSSDHSGAAWSNY